MRDYIHIDTTTIMEFKGKQKRNECYKARDAYYECLDLNESKQPNGSCQRLLQEFEKNCGTKWTEHFIRKRSYEKFKEKVYKEGVDAVDQKNIN